MADGRYYGNSYFFQIHTYISKLILVFVVVVVVVIVSYVSSHVFCCFCARSSLAYLIYVGPVMDLVFFSVCVVGFVYTAYVYVCWGVLLADLEKEEATDVESSKRSRL